MSMRSPSTLTLPILTVALSLLLPGALQAQQAASATKSPGKWSVPRTPWGDPDLQGSFTNKDENGTPFERPADLAGKTLSDFGDKELAELRKTRQARAQAGAGRIGGSEEEDTGAGPSHWYEHLNASNSQAWFVFEPADGTIPPLTKEARDRAAARQAARRGRGPADSWTDRSLYDRCITPRHPRLDDAGDLRQRLRHHAGSRLRGHPLRDDPRDAHHPARQQPAPAGLVPALRRRRARPLGRRHAGGRDHQLQRGVRLPRREPQPEDDRALHADRPEHDQVGSPLRGSGHVGAAVGDDHAAQARRRGRACSSTPATRATAAWRTSCAPPGPKKPRPAAEVRRRRPCRSVSRCLRSGSSSFTLPLAAGNGGLSAGKADDLGFSPSAWRGCARRCSATSMPARCRAR